MDYHFIKSYINLRNMQSTIKVAVYLHQDTQYGHRDVEGIATQACRWVTITDGRRVQDLEVSPVAAMGGRNGDIEWLLELGRVIDMFCSKESLHAAFEAGEIDSY
jgi:hypothetical protein